MSHKSADHEAVWKTVQSINEAWVMGQLQKLTEYFRPNIVMVLPDFEGRAEGAEAIINTYKQFCDNATVYHFMEGENPHIDIDGNTAMVCYSYDVKYGLGTKIFEGEGQEIWALVKDDGRWQATWRMMTDIEEREAAD